MLGDAVDQFLHGFGVEVLPRLVRIANQRLDRNLQQFPVAGRTILIRFDSRWEAGNMFGHQFLFGRSELTHADKPGQATTKPASTGRSLRGGFHRMIRSRIVGNRRHGRCSAGRLGGEF